MANIVIIGGTSGIGRELAGHLAGQGDSVVLTGRDAERARQVAREVGKGRHNVRGIALDLAEPHEIARALSGIGPVDHLVITAVERDVNSVRDYSVDRAVRLATLKVVGYTAAVAALREVMAPTGSVVLFGGVAKDAPYPGSTTVTAVNGAVVSMVRTLSTELAPVRVNAVHPGIVSDTPSWSGQADVLESVRSRTPTGRLATMADIVGATVFLMRNPAVNRVNLTVDGGMV
ncbi:Cis-2,3-dihydrobiphenyl-2,3-diol dehydrogenase [Streptomyces sp. ADI95-16]|uniref:SDR family oxidoreductase n=1 Tax=Streptomyces sp. ADI95-16 TaxID=1522758 RepID=UPI000F3A8149|nr:SDR family oxidoreductase [Streptomyces sp. ADI95-16]AYV25247.1 Cis-2,3-dihydrobiphenyl-2,3-diol dehydrogenase [Streptomyces sp. ADI95-16]